MIPKIYLCNPAVAHAAKVHTHYLVYIQVELDPPSSYAISQNGFIKGRVFELISHHRDAFNMARRTSTMDSNDTTVVKAEKTRVKEEKVRDKGKRRAVEPEDDAEEQENEQEEEVDAEEMAASPKGAKRRRVNDEGDSVPSPAPDGDDEPEEEPEPPRAQTLPRDVDGYAFSVLFFGV